RAAWQHFFDHYLDTIYASVRKHVHWGPGQADLAEEITQQVCVLLFSEERILEAFLNQQLSLRSFLAKLAHASVRQAYKRLSRQKTVPISRPEDLPDGVHLDWLDLASVQELAARLSPSLAQYLREILEPEPVEPDRPGRARIARRTPASDRERQMKRRLLLALREIGRDQ